MEELLKSLASGGIPGIILAILLWKFLPALTEFRDEVRANQRFIRDAIDRSSKADMLRLIASPHVADSVKSAAAELVDQIKEVPEMADKKAVPKVV